MERNKAENIIKNCFQDIPKTSKFIFYRNPEDCITFKLERINPDHIGIVYGLRKRKIRKTKGNSYIRVCKVYFSQLLGFLNVQYNIYLQQLYDLLQNTNPTILLINCCTAAIILGFLLMFTGTSFISHKMITTT